MQILRLLVPPALMMCTACASNNSVPSKPLPDLPPCPTQAMQACEPPVKPTGRTLAETEREDAENRRLWEACVIRHNQARACIAAYQRLWADTAARAK